MPRKTVRNVYAVLVLDESGSMSHIVSAADRCVRDLIKTYAEPEPGVQCHVGLVSVRSSVSVKAPITLAAQLTPPTYYASGGTALLDGIGMAVSMLDGVKLRKGDVCAVTVITDGEENESRTYTASSLQALLTERRATDRWTFAFNVPTTYAKRQLETWGISGDNVRVWDTTERGMVETAQVNASALRSFKSMVATNASFQSSQSYYVNTDLSGVSAKQLHTKLDDISDKFKVVSVDKESVVRSAVEAKTKRPYVIGQAYYQLMKPEKVQPSKRVLIMEKGKKAVWGGKQARDLLGLPHDKVAKVTPGNHANYDVFVQSASTNRKLPRGTKLLIDTTQVTGVAPTWESTVTTLTNGGQP